MIRFVTVFCLWWPLACVPDQDTDWVVVSQGSLSIGVEVEGTLAATDSATVGPPAIRGIRNYKIARMAPEGEVVKQGDMLVSFDSSSLIEKLRRKKNERDAARVKLDKQLHKIALSEREQELEVAKKEADLRKKKLAVGLSPELTANVEIQKAIIEVQQAQDGLKYQRSQRSRRRAVNRSEVATLRDGVGLVTGEVEQLQRDIARMKVVAGRSGTVIYTKPRWRHQKYKVGDSVWQRSSVMEVASLDSMMAEGIVEEADMAKLAQGQQVRLRLEAHPDNEVRGALQEISRSVRSKSREVPTKVVGVKMRIISGLGLQLRPGMRFRGEVETEVVDNAVIVPANSVFSSEVGPVAYRQRGGKTQRVPVELGKRGKRGVQVLAGLVPGDKVSRLVPQ